MGTGDFEASDRQIPGEGRTLSLAEERRFLALVGELEDLPEAEWEERLTGVEAGLAARVRERLSEATGSMPGSGSPTGSDPGDHRVARLAPGDQVGPYRVVESLGSGGMGRVYLAQQTEPIQRTVALKVLRLNLRQGGARERFDVERHAMGRLDHPHVAKILDAGVTADGTPYLAMEWIDGTPLRAYCRERDLSIAERLRLFVQVCRGVDHAHRKFLLHRDIKPSNVLVAEVDGRPVPKLIDFGVAQFVDHTVRDDGTGPDGGSGGRPGLGDGFGTPRYMSPEALRRGRDVDTRSDVFSLGVLLYEMLAGRRPWDEDQGDWRQVAEARATLEPPPPSSATASLGPADGADPPPRGRARALRGDLDAIVMTALARDPEDRYPSAAALADDVQRHLDLRPVEARAGGGFYRLGRLWRRHRLGAVAVLALTLAILAGSVGTGLGLVRARRAEESARAEAEAARRARADAEVVSDFVVGLFGRTSPTADDTTRSASETTALQLLERGAASLEDDLQDQPLTRARLEQTVGSVYRQLGRFEPAETHLDRALELLQEAPEVEPRQLAQTLVRRAELDLNRADAEAAGQRLERALEVLGDGDTREDQKVRADVLGNLGRQRRLASDFAGAEEVLLQVIELETELVGAESYNVAANRSNLGSLYFAQNRWADAEAQWRVALATLRRIRGPEHATVATLSDNLGAALASQGRLAEAAPLFEGSLRIRRRILGDSHPRISDTYNNLGVLYTDLGDRRRALEYHRKALAIRQRAFGDDHPTTAWSLDNLAHVLADLGQHRQAEELQRRALAVREAQYGADHLEVARSLDHLADLALEEGDAGRAVDLRRRVLAIRQAGLESDNPLLAFSEVELGEALWHAGDREAARPRIDQGLAALEAAGEPGADDLAEATERVAALGD